VVRNFKTKKRFRLCRKREREKKKLSKKNRTEGRKYVNNLDFEITIKNLIEKKNRKKIRTILFN